MFKRTVIFTVLTVDIGNARTEIGMFDGDAVVFKAAIESARSKTDYEYAGMLQSLIALQGISAKSVTGAIISSVVPKLTDTLKNAVGLVFKVEALIVGPGIKTGLKIRCDDPSSVGADLICACVAAKQLYPLPCLIVDMGTATKLILVDEEGAF